MDAIRVAKVEGVLCTKGGSTSAGTLHLTAHHAIFRFDGEDKEEMWVPYPLISLVSRMPTALSGRCPLTIHTRTFETVFLSFASEREAIDVFESVKELTVATSVTQLYAFFYVPNPPYATSDGWSIYSPREEFGRMGVGTRTKAWRFTDINKDYSFSPTYPARMVVPTRISDTTLQYAAKYRSKARLPILTYLHWANYGSITRSSQPMVGLTSNRSIQDEKLIEAIFQTHHAPDSRVGGSTVYGATATNLIIDARPTTNAMANTAKGAGTENMDHYRDAKKAYLGIDHIHVMRESLNRVVEALRETELVTAALASNSGTGVIDEAQDVADIPPPPLDRQALRRSGWLRHITAIMEGTLLIVRNVHINSSHVLIHCSDGWDRTAQLSALSQLCLDPYYRTTRGFMVLVEKDWLAFGHKFLDRCGHLSSEKFFVAPAEADAGGAEAFLTSMQNRFAGQGHIKETSPVFHQFLESVRQVQRQFPERFEFNERFLRRLLHHLYACQYGTFLANCERERRVGEGGAPPLVERTTSVWEHFRREEELALNRNPEYDPSLDDRASRAPKADMGVLLPNPKDVRFWHELYGRTDEEMNGRFVAKAAAEESGAATPVDAMEEESAEGPDAGTPPAALTPSSPLASAPALIQSIPVPQSLARFITQRGASPLPQAESSAAAEARQRSKTADSPASPSLVPPRTPSPTVRAQSPRAGDLFANAGVRSMWGRFSSNASAAFTAVQGAYDGLAKDLRGMTVAGDEARGGELKSRDDLGAAWSVGAGTGAGAGPGAGGTINPWATSRGARPGIPSVYLDNPWGSVRAPRDVAISPGGLGEGVLGSGGPTVASPIESAAALPLDPTVALPGSTPTGTISRRTRVPLESESMGMGSEGALGEPKGQAKDAAAGPAQAGSVDPLGVGVW